jgi:purine catabolism regulator
VAVAVPSTHPAVLVVEPVGDRLPSTVLLQHAAAGAALAVQQLLARSERQIRAGSDLFTRLVERRIEPGSAQRGLATFGVVLDSRMVIMAVPGDAVTPERLALSFAAHDQPHLLLGRDGRVHLLIERDALASPRLLGIWAALPHLGISEAVPSADRVPDAVVEAQWALALAVSEDVPLIRYGAGPVLAGQSPADARHVVGAVLGALLQADVDGSDHVATIRALLEHDRSWQRAAEALHIHKQTLRYRLRRIETITGRGFVHTDDLAAWWVALRAQRTLRAFGGTPVDGPAGPDDQLARARSLGLP